MNRVPSVILALVLLGAVGARSAELTPAASGVAAGIAEDVGRIRAAWMRSFLHLNEAGQGAAADKPTFLLFTLSNAVMGKDVQVLVLRVGSRYAAGDAWIPAFGAALGVEPVKPSSTSGVGAEKEIRESIELTVPKRVVLEDQDARYAFTVRLKPADRTMAGTYQVRVGSVDKSGPASVQAHALGPGDAFPPDFPLFKPAGKSPVELAAGAIELEEEACRRYRDLLWIEGALRALAREGIPSYPAPLRAAPAGGGAAKAGDRNEPPTGLDDPGDLGSLEITTRQKKPQTPDKTAERPPAEGESAIPAPVTAESLDEIREHVGRICAVAEGFAKAGAGGQAPAAAGVPCADPLFGPWFGFAPLDSDKDRINLLPAGVGGPGRQEWRHVDRWKAFGPIPVDAPSTECANLPHRFLLPGAVYQVFKQFLPRPKPAANDDTTPEPGSSPQVRAIETGMRWMPWQVEPATGVLRPPQWYSASGSGYGSIPCGHANTTWFAATEIHSESDCEVWVALGCDDDAQVWINDRMIATWPDARSRQDMESPIVFRTAFRKGRNTVTARIRQLQGAHDGAQSTSCLWMKVCTRGAPGDPAAVAAKEAAVAERQKALRPFGPEVRGWRGNWHGVEPDARPVTAWDYDRGVNVRWTIGLPPTISSPLLVGDRIFTTSMPHNLFCLDKMTGKRIWRAAFDLLDVLEPAIAAEAKPINDAYVELQQQVFHRAEYPEDTGQATVKDGDKVLSMKEGAQRCRELSNELCKLLEGGLKKHDHSLNYLWSGHMWPECSTPVTDGKFIWLRSASGAAACFTLDGERKWLVETPHRSSAYNAFSSPLLVDGLLLMEVVPNDKSRPGGSWGGCEWRDVVLLALDAATGKERWRSPVLNTIGTSSPVAMRITDGKEDLAVVVTGGSGNARLLPDGRFQGGFLGGTVVRVSDGKVLIPNLSVNTGYGTAVAVGDVVYHCGLSQMTATRLIMVDRDTLGAKRLWTRPFHRGLEPCVSPLDGKLFANVAIGTVGGQGHAGYVILDRATGAELPRHVNVDWPLFTTRSVWGGSGRCYVPTAVAGPVIFLADEGEAFGGKDPKGPLSKNPYANCVALEAREQGRLIAQNALPPRSNSALLFDGDRMYYRNTFGMVCLGHTGDEGKAYEAEVNARYVLEDLDLEPPATGAAVAIAPQARLPPELPRQENLWNRYSRPFAIVGPLPAESRSSAMAALAGRQAWSSVFGGRGVSVGNDPGPAFTPGRLGRRGRVAMVTQGGFEVFKAWETAGKPAGQSVVFAAVTQVRSPMTVRFVSRTSSPRVRATFAGVELKHQARYRLQPGEYAYLAEMDLGEADEEARLDFYFVRSAEDPQEDVRAWQQDVQGARAYLERVVKLKPDGETAKKAAETLARMK